MPGFADPRTTVSLREATHEFHRYLSGEIAPMMAIEAFEPLIAHPPEVTAQIIGEWIEKQLEDPDIEVLTSDLLFHALRKLHDFSAFGLLAKGAMARYLGELTRLMVELCPESERNELAVRLSRMDEKETVLAPRAEYLHREKTAAQVERGKGPGQASARKRAAQAAGRAGADRESAGGRTARDIRRLSLLLDRLKRMPEPVAPPPPMSTRTGLLAQTLSTAALQSDSEEDLGRILQQVGCGGEDAPLGTIFRALSWHLPGWTLRAAGGESVEPPPPNRLIQAMGRIVSIAPDSEERARRWGEMIYAAIEQFNEGRLAQAVSVIEAAKRLIAEANADAVVVTRLLSQAQYAISEEVLRRHVESAEKRSLVRRVLEVFPAYQPEGLLKTLEAEARRDRRKLLLALLECHGKQCRDLLLTRLAACLKGTPPDEAGYFRRNLAFLLRRIPRPRNERLDEEVALLGSMIARGEPALSAKEAIGALGQIRCTGAEDILARRLQELESETASADSAHARDLMDRLCAALALQGTSAAIRSVVAHAFLRAPALGNTMARIEKLSWLDLSVDPEQLAIIVERIRSLVPSRVLGFVVKRSNQELTCLMRAVSGTPTEEVRLVLQEISEGFREHTLGKQAAEALAKLEPRARAAPAPEEPLTGDLDVFGLPGLLQSLSGSQSSGELVLFDRSRTRRAAMVFSEGSLVRCQAGRLTGAEALYLVLERPFPGTFVLRTSADGGAAAHEGAALDLMGLILEGLRRHDDDQLARTIVPDGVSLEPGGAAAVPPEEERDDALVSCVWAAASAGSRPEACEAEAQVDPYRVRRLLAHWVEQGALRPRLSASA